MVEQKKSIETAGYDISICGSLIEDGEICVTVDGEEHVFNSSDGELTVDNEEAHLETENGYVHEEDNEIRISLSDGSYIEINPFEKIFTNDEVRIERRNKRSDTEFSDLVDVIDISEESIALFCIAIVLYNPMLLVASFLLALDGNIWAVSYYLDSLGSNATVDEVENIKNQFISGEINIDEFDDRIENYIRDSENQSSRQIKETHNQLN